MFIPNDGGGAAIIPNSKVNTNDTEVPIAPWEMEAAKSPANFLLGFLTKHVLISTINLAPQ